MPRRGIAAEIRDYIVNHPHVPERDYRCLFPEADARHFSQARYQAKGILNAEVQKTDRPTESEGEVLLGKEDPFDRLKAHFEQVLEENRNLRERLKAWQAKAAKLNEDIETMMRNGN